jgi:hemoglobin-like flavoprotein
MRVMIDLFAIIRSSPTATTASIVVGGTGMKMTGVPPSENLIAHLLVFGFCLVRALSRTLSLPLHIL